MVSIDTVYQRVLALANKEQRGYITPQEFNLFANQAQMEIFEQYFYDLKSDRRIPGNDTVYSDVSGILEEKMQIFERSEAVLNSGANLNVGTPLQSVSYGYDYNPGFGETADGKRVTFPDYVYRINEVNGQSTATTLGGRKAEILNTKDFENALRGPYLLQPKGTQFIANIKNNSIVITNNVSGFLSNGGNTDRSFYINFFKKPTKVEWSYVIVNDKALYNDNISVDFELHPSEETELVYRILKYSGVSLKAEDVMQVSQALEMAQTQQEKQ